MRIYFHFFVVLSLATVSRAEVKVWQGKLTLPTYEEGMPDPNPAFDQFASNRFNYPYTLRDKLTSRRANHDWRAIYLENEYLKCSVLPDIGGHVYTCIDKTSGQSMFYANPSIKKAAVGYRGAWAAFGIEFNFPVSHNWASMSPVNFAFRNNPDGSASVIVGNVDRVYGMEWTVELMLRPQSTLLEERVTLSNRSDVRHRFYWWNNAATRVSDDSRIVYPMRFAASHGFTEVTPWPLDQDGHDLSIIRNHVHGAVSLFTHGSRENFMGVWHPATRTGTVHFAEYEQLPAKKIWSWGVDAEGLDWRKALSDDNSGYVEIQAGLFRNQETYAFMDPRQTIQFSEYWMPVREIDGISRATLAGVVSLTRNGNHLTVGFNANHAFPGAKISILDRNKRLFGETVDLAPDHAWIHELPLQDAAARYTIEIRDAQSEVLIRQTEGEYDWDPESEIHVGPQASYHIPDEEKRTCDDWIQLGEEYELNGRIVRALDIYKDALRRFPASFDATKSAGRLAASLLRYEEAKTFLESAHARHTADPEVSYYLGIAYDGLGETRKAQTAYEDAQRFSSFRAASALKLGEMLAREGNLAESERHLALAASTASNDSRVHEALAAITFAAGKTQTAKSLAQQSLMRFPLSSFLREEAGDPDLKQLADDSTRVLNLGAQYMRLGLYQRALDVLSRDYPPAPADQSEPGEPSPGRHPMIAYFRGYCREHLGQPATADYKLASQLSTAYVFPSTAEELTVLRAALQANPEDASVHYLLGTLYFSRGLTDLALSEWARARESNHKIPVLDASLGLALLHEKHDPERAISAFRDGLQSDPANVTIYLGADQALSLLAKPARERTEVLEKYPDLANAPSGLIFELILNLSEAGDFQRAENLFHNRFFPREEGGTNVRQVWVEVEVQKLLAMARNGRCAEAQATADHLGTPVDGLPFTKDGLEPFLQSARTNYLVGTAYDSCGRSDEAKRKFKNASTATAPDELLWAWLAAKKLSGTDEKQWQERLQSALTQVENRSENSSYPGWWDYSAGALAAALGHEKEANQRFQKALLLPDRMLSYHLTRLARLQTVERITAMK
jgi:tetratricopeptide (TPR) repeat protein